MTSELKILVDSGREVTHAEATNYSPTNKPIKVPKVKKAKTADDAVEKNDDTTTTKPKATTSRLFIRLQSSEDQATLMALKTIIDANSGNTEVVLVLGSEENRQIVKLPMQVQHNEQVQSELRELVGASNIKVT